MRRPFTHVHSLHSDTVLIVVAGCNFLFSNLGLLPRNPFQFVFSIKATVKNRIYDTVVCLCLFFFLLGFAFDNKFHTLFPLNNVCYFVFRLAYSFTWVFIDTFLFACIHFSEPSLAKLHSDFRSVLVVMMVKVVVRKLHGLLCRHDTVYLFQLVG